jgi:hypothetical protein
MIGYCTFLKYMSFWCWNHVSMINIVTYHLVSKQTILYSDPLCLSIGSSFIFTQAPLSAPPLVITVKNCSDCQMIFCWSRSSPGLQSTGISNGFYFFQNQQNLIIFSSEKKNQVISILCYKESMYWICPLFQSFF